MKWFGREKVCRDCGKSFRRAGKICGECLARRRRDVQGSPVVGVVVSYVPGYDPTQDEEIRAILKRVRVQERGEVTDLDEDEAEALADEEAWDYEADDGSYGTAKWT